jgi:hypothetical protein
MTGGLPVAAPTGKARPMDCLRCRNVPLVADIGALHEAVCPGCQGRLLDGDAAMRLLQDHCGLERGLIGELCAHYRGRTPCPACGRGMSLVPVVGVSVDLCGGCGSLFLDAGELGRLSRGAIVEVAATAPPVLEDPFGPPPAPAPLAPVASATSVTAPIPGVATTTPAPVAARPPGRDAAVFLVEALGPDEGALLLEVWAAAGFRTAVDARAMLSRAVGGVFADDCSVGDGHRLVAALARVGRAAAVIDDATLSPPAPYRLKELGVFPDRLVVRDALGRARTLAIAEIRALCAGRVRVVVTEDASRRQPGPGPLRQVAGAMAPRLLRQLSEHRELASRAPLTSMVEREQTFLDIVVAGERFRLDEAGFVARADGPRDLAAVASRLEGVAPTTTVRQRGFLALAGGGGLPSFRSVREYDREVTRALWLRLM